MAIKKSAFGTTVYQAGTVQEEINYINKRGLYQGTISKVYGTSTDDGTHHFVTFEIDTPQGRITSKGYFGKMGKDGLEESKGSNLTKALLAFSNKGKDKVIGTWTATVVKQYGKDVNAKELAVLKNIEVACLVKEVRELYENKDNEVKAKKNLEVVNFFGVDGDNVYSLREWEEGVEVDSLKGYSSAKQRADKDIGLISYKKGTDKDEWIMYDEEANGTSDSSEKKPTKSAGLAELPTLGEAPATTETDTPAPLPESPTEEITPDLSTPATADSELPNLSQDGDVATLDSLPQL